MPSNGLRRILLLAALLSIALSLVVAGLRLAHPFELEWLEGGVLDQAIWVRSGRPLYVAPTFEHIPFLYNPLYTYLVAIVMEGAGEGFVAGRLVSLGATCANYVLIIVIARGVSGSRVSGCIAAGLFAASYGWCGSLFDIGRVDPLLATWCLIAFLCATRKTTRRWFLVGAVAMFLALMTKQSALATIAGIVVGMWIRERRAAVVAGAVFLVLTGVAVAVLQFASDGWYWFYVFDVPRHGGLGHDMLGFFVQYEFWRIVPALLLLVVGMVAAYRSGDRHVLPIYCATVCTVLGCVVATAHPAAGMNAWVIGSAFVAIALCAQPMDRLRSVLLLVQFGFFVYDPSAFVPTRADVAAGHRVVRLIAARPGPVFVPYHGALGTMAGKGRWAHLQALTDTMASADPRALRSLGESYVTVFERDNPPTVLFIDLDPAALGQVPFLRGYRVAERIAYEDVAAFRSVALARRGAPRPDLILTR